MISKEEVKHIAALAGVGVNEDEIEKFSYDLSSILDWIEELKAVDIEGVEPTAHISGIVNRMREDRAHDFANKSGIVKMFPEEKNGYDKVKSVL